jgi:hypothetical protein
MAGDVLRRADCVIGCSVDNCGYQNAALSTLDGMRSCRT